MNEKIKAARHLLGGFLQERRQQMGRSREDLAVFLGISAETVKGVETGRFACDIDQMFKICTALEIKPYFVPIEEISISEGDRKEAFLLAVNEEDKELYILHREYPACLIHVLQTTPATFKIVDLYDNISEEDLLKHPFLEEAKNFYKQKAIKNFGGN